MTTKRRGAAFLAVAAASALVLAACGGDDADETPADDDGGAAEEQPDPDTGEGPSDVEVVYAAEQEFTNYANNTSEGNLLANTHVLNQVKGGFWNYGPDGLVVPDEEFGTYDLVSDDPQTIEFNINPDAVWSDGEPIDCDDFLLGWAAQSGYYEHPTETTADGEPATLFSTAGTTGYADWVKPDCEPGDKTITVEYETVNASWVLYTAVDMPAHVVAREGGMASGDELIEAIRNDDIDALLPAAEFYNTGFVMSPGELLPEEIIPSSGRYKLTDWQAGQSITMEYNENYWGTPPAARTIIFRFLDANQQAQALQNQEIDIMDPQPSTDLVNQLEGMAGVEVHVDESFTYEHVDFNLRGDHYFNDPNLRRSFGLCLPRQLMVENLIHPQNPDAEVLNARLTYSFQPDYDFQIDGNGWEDFAEQDIDESRRLLEEADMVGTEVRIVYTEANPRRVDQVALIRDACNQAGWDVVDAGSADPFGVEIPDGNFDVAMYAWIGSGYVAGTASTFMTPSSCTPEGTGNNSQCYSSEVVDDLYRELLQEVDVDAQRELVKQIETQLWADLPTIPLFTHPYLLAWAEDVEGITPNPTQQGVTSTKHEWNRAL
ncbi:ABC transporter family substrate-binding protein [Phytoactinopolyspora alkaliphila]|uniref:ABC transporter family substrate-binding protein n=1 Tax=Phytoactinopolyspora alkaliphila TaxID=1783498 RepID=A0A6N9YSY9_9ACTN|nr:ABC transporter substrate-binding protein [Phytoactinopolyspora alkaliphila]NED98060.1 ABC transporter family substrate-binding protein [Phytoactinopolyspora alkaliphila]